ncbi:DUF427 domain-containing protein [soil metagenome]
MKAVWNGMIVAESEDTIVVEGNHYFPPESVNESLLEKTKARSLCPWKGMASYYTVAADGEANQNAAWTYRQPFPWIRKIRNHVAFWNGVEVN